MNIALRIARKYLFSRKSTNAINIIAGITVFGISAGTATLILVMSVFNGFETLILSMFNYFNPDVKVIAAEGKTFREDSTLILKLRSIEGVQSISGSLEEIAFFEYKGSQVVGRIKGVDSLYDEVTGLDATVVDGNYQFEDENRSLAVIGAGLERQLSINISDYLAPIQVYMPKRSRVGAFEKPFKKRVIYPGGIFTIQQDYDNEYMFTSLNFARELLDLPQELSSLEIKTTADSDLRTVAERIRETLGPQYLVEDRYQQDEAFLKIMNVEKWMGFAVLSLTLILVAFNMIGTLWMIVLEKKRDIAILKSMGATDQLVKRIFLTQGTLLSLVGIGIGTILALGFYFLHKQYDLIGLEGAFIVDAYPMEVRLTDLLVIGLTVVGIGLIASWLPARRAEAIEPILREE